jgi:hypothetical protein
MHQIVNDCFEIKIFLKIVKLIGRLLIIYNYNNYYHIIINELQKYEDTNNSITINNLPIT